ncbi:RING-type domain-containing protein [Entamoeba marina]
MQYQLHIQQISDLSPNVKQLSILIGFPPNRTQQIQINILSTATLIDFFDSLQKEMSLLHLLPSQYTIQYKQFGPICKEPVMSLFQHFSTIELMTEEQYNFVESGCMEEIPLIKEEQEVILEKAYFVSCHRCKTRRDECYRCPIHPKHKFCESCINRYTTLERFKKEGCPICAKQCQCASCKRRELKRLGIDAPLPKR